MHSSKECLSGKKFLCYSRNHCQCQSALDGTIQGYPYLHHPSQPTWRTANSRMHHSLVVPVPSRWPSHLSRVCCHQADYCHHSRNTHPSSSMSDHLSLDGTACT